MQVTQKKLLIKMMQSSMNLCNNYTPEEKLLAQCHLHKLHQLLPQLDIAGLDLQRNIKDVQKKVGIWTIIEQFPLRISLYYLPKGFTMKLHDHPKMEVICYLIKGKMKAILFSHKHGDIYSKTSTIVNPGQYSFIEGQRTSQKNLHQFHGVQPTFFMDIMFPDYTNQRPCTFYDQVESIDESTSRLKVNPSAEVDFFDLKW